MENFPKNESDLKAIGERIKHFRKEKGLTQDQLQEILNLKNRQSIINYEKGIQLTIPLLLSLSRVLKTPTHEFFPAQSTHDGEIVSKDEDEDPTIKESREIYKELRFYFDTISIDFKYLLLQQAMFFSFSENAKSVHERFKGFMNKIKNNKD